MTWLPEIRGLEIGELVGRIVSDGMMNEGIFGDDENPLRTTGRVGAVSRGGGEGR